MKNIVTTIKFTYDGLSKTDKIIADYFITNINQVPYQSIHELASSINVSVSSLSRFARTIGFKNFKDLKINLASAVISHMQDMYNVIDKKDKEKDIINKVFIGNASSLEDTLKNLNYQDVVNFSKECANAERIVFFGIGSSGNIAREASLRFTHLNIQTEAYSETTYMIFQAARMKKKQVAIGISHSGRSVDTIQALKQSSKNGALTAAITNYPKSPLRQICNYFFCTSFFEGKVKAATVIPLIPQICLIDSLFLLVAYNKKDGWSIDNEQSINEEYLRTKIKGTSIDALGKS